MINTVELTPKDFNHAAILLAEAFYDNPPHVCIFPDSATRFESLQWGLKAFLKLNLSPPTPIGKSFALVEANQPPGIRQVKAMAFWNYPESKSASFISKLKSGWLTIPFKYDRATFQRLKKAMMAIDETKKEVLGQNKAWYLNNMVVAKELRGTGVGSKLLGHQLESVVIPSGFPAIAMTQKEINVKFYQKLGFKIANKSTTSIGRNSFTNWCLIFN